MGITAIINQNVSRDIAETLHKTADDLNTKLYKVKIRENIAIKEAQAARQIYTAMPQTATEQ